MPSLKQRPNTLQCPVLPVTGPECRSDTASFDGEASCNPILNSEEGCTMTIGVEIGQLAFERDARDFDITDRSLRLGKDPCHRQPGSRLLRSAGRL